MKYEIQLDNSIDNITLTTMCEFEADSHEEALEKIEQARFYNNVAPDWDGCACVNGKYMTLD